MNIVTVNNVDLPVMEHREQRVITLAQVDAVHGRPSGTAGRNFREHRARFVEGVDYFEANQPDEIRRLGLIRPQGGTPDRVILLTETGYTMLVKPFNDDLAWQVQRQIVSGYFAAKRLIAEMPHQLTGYVADGCTLIESFKRTMNPAASTTLGMYQKLADSSGHARLLPAYAVDSPANDGSSHATKALKDLLDQFGVGLSSRKVYPLLEKAGLMEHRSRPSSKGGSKRFWSFSEAGLAYGKNMSHPSNQRETQPHFYESEFSKLLGVVGLGMKKAA